MRRGFAGKLPWATAASGPIAQVARDLGIIEGILGNWLDWRRRHKPAQPGTTSAPGSPATPRSPWSASQWLLP
jgi:transposase-like protein